jgi:hypothetical protein
MAISYHWAVFKEKLLTENDFCIFFCNFNLETVAHADHNFECDLPHREIYQSCSVWVFGKYAEYGDFDLSYFI